MVVDFHVHPFRDAAHCLNFYPERQDFSNPRRELEEAGISARVIDMYCLKPLDAETVIKAAKETKAIVTVEEHSINGGLGELVSHVVVENAPCRMAILGFPDEEYIVGKSAELFKHYGLTPENIAANARRLLTGVAE